MQHLSISPARKRTVALLCPRSRLRIAIHYSLICLAISCSTLIEHTAKASPTDAKTLTGDWGGLRSELAGEGVLFTAIYTSEAADNPRGGEEQRAAYADEWAFGATLDLQKLLSLRAAEFHLTITERYGQDLDQMADLHTLMQVQEIYGRGQTWRLTEFWYQEKWLDDHLVWKFGRLPVGENFGSSDCHFQNLTFCGTQPGSVRGDYWYNYPVSQWATRLDYAVTEELKLKLGLYQVNPTYINDSWAAHNGLLPDNPSGTTGALIPLEVDWMPKLLGLPDNYKFGVWYDTSNANDVYYDINHQPLVLTGAAPLRRNGQSGVYISFEQQISGVALGRGAQLFLNFTQSDKNTSPLLDRQLAVGVQYAGIFHSRPSDVMGVAIGESHVNSRVADGQRLVDEYTGASVPVQRSEYVSEIYYAWTPWPYLILRPNLQSIVHPGGSDAYKNEIVVGLKTTVKF